MKLKMEKLSLWNPIKIKSKTANKTIIKHKLIDPRKTGVELVCYANKAQTINPCLTGVELVCVTLTKYKLSIPDHLTIPV